SEESEPTRWYSAGKSRLASSSTSPAYDETPLRRTSSASRASAPSKASSTLASTRSTRACTSSAGEGGGGAATGARARGRARADWPAGNRAGGRGAAPRSNGSLPSAGFAGRTEVDFLLRVPAIAGPV